MCSPPLDHIHTWRRSGVPRGPSRPSFQLWLSQAELVAHVFCLQLARPGSQCPPTATDEKQCPRLTVKTLSDLIGEGGRLVWEKGLDGGRCGEAQEAGEVLNVSLLPMGVWCDSRMVECARPCGIRHMKA